MYIVNSLRTKVVVFCRLLYKRLPRTSPYVYSTSDRNITRGLPLLISKTFPISQLKYPPLFVSNSYLVDFHWGGQEGCWPTRDAFPTKTGRARFHTRTTPLRPRSPAYIMPDYLYY